MEIQNCKAQLIDSKPWPPYLLSLQTASIVYLNLNTFKISVILTLHSQNSNVYEKLLTLSRTIQAPV